MKKTSLLIFLLPFFLHSQDPAVDSLKQVLKTAKHDTTRCIILNALAETASEAEWPLYNEQLKKLAETNSRNLPSSDPLKLFYLRHLAGALNNDGIIAYGLGEYERAAASYKKSIAIQKETGNKKKISEAINNLALLYAGQGNMALALEYYNKTLEIQKEIKDKKVISACLNNMGTLYEAQGNIPMALDYYHRSLKIREEAKDKNGISNSLNKLGACYYLQGESEKALEYYQKSLKLRLEINDKRAIAICLNNIAVIYDDQGNLVKALETYRASLKISEAIHDEFGSTLCLDNIGTLLAKQNKDSEALSCFEKSLKITEAKNDRLKMSRTLAFIANLLLKTGRTGTAYTAGMRSLKIARELKFPREIKNAAYALKTIYRKQGKYKESLEMYELEIWMRDSLINDETKKASTKTQLKYEYEKKAAADSVKNAEEQKVKDARLSAQNATLKQEKFQRYSLIVGLLIVLAGLGFVINRFRITNKQKKIIEEQKIIVDEAFEKLHEKNKEVMDSIYYARRIQRALITNEKYIERTLRKLK